MMIVMRFFFATFALLAVELAVMPASARYISVQCGVRAFDISTDAKLVVRRRDSRGPARLMQHSVIDDDAFQADYPITESSTALTIIDRKTGIVVEFTDGKLTSAARCVPRSAGSPAPQPSSDGHAPAGNKF